MKIFELITFGGLILFSLSCNTGKTTQADKPGLKLVWSDEFNKAGLPDTTKWSYNTGDGCPDICGWGNNELEYYQAFNSKNARVENGFLVIEAHREKTGNKDYSSAKLVSKHKGDWTYGRIEARAKLPQGKGTWAAFWMLPSHTVYGGWPTSGEIDIMEHVGFMPDSILGTIHTGKYNGMMGTQVTSGVHTTDVHDQFHVYAIEWNSEKIDFFFDDQKYQTFSNQHQDLASWPFDRDFHVILNLAVGGDWGGKMGVDTTIWPQKMLVDYVKVYQAK